MSIYKLLQKYCFITVFISCQLVFFSTKAQISVNYSYTVQQLVSDVLLGSGISVSNITYNGNSVAIGFFDGTNSNIGLDSGVVIASGDINVSIGPNNSTGAGVDLLEPGDADLNSICASTTFDAAVIEFDFIPASNTVSFKYVFGSEEYMEYVNAGYNDVFGFFISGPGITGKPNIAIVPGTSSTPVSIDNVNLFTNPTYYFDNENPMGTTVQFDGFTTVLEAKTDVIPCETYHIKLAVADAGDGILDSGVFLEAGSFDGGVSADYIITQAADDSSMYEGCSESQIIFTRSGTLDSTQTVKLTVDGTAQNGIDYSLIPDSVIFPIGEDSLILTISTYLDTNIEPIESIIVNIINDLCADSVSFTVSMNIVDVEDLVVVAMPDTTICPGDSVLLTASISGGVAGTYLIEWENYLPGDTTVYGNNGVYTINVIDSCGRTGSDMVEIQSLGFVSGFLYDYQTDTIVNFYSQSTDSVISWDFGDGSVSTEPNPTHTYSDTGTYQIELVVVNDMGCVDTIRQYVTIVIEDPYNFFIPNTFTPDGDGLNDLFIGIGENVKTFQMYIYNRWGEMIYSTPTITKPWNGKTENGNEAIEDAYQYLMLVTNTKQEEYVYRGLITLIR